MTGFGGDGFGTGFGTGVKREGEGFDKSMSLIFQFLKLALENLLRNCRLCSFVHGPLSIFTPSNQVRFATSCSS